MATRTQSTMSTVLLFTLLSVILFFIWASQPFHGGPATNWEVKIIPVLTGDLPFPDFNPNNLPM